MISSVDNRTNFDDVGDFHEKFDLDNTTHHDIGPRTELDKSILPFRVNFMVEELMEFVEAIGASYDPITGEVKFHGAPIDHAKAFDALIDLVYVAMGTAHFLGYPWQMGWRLVQRANMAKVRAQKDASDSKRNSSFDVVKPPGWTPPDLSRLLSRMGFNILEETK